MVKDILKEEIEKVVEKLFGIQAPSSFNISPSERFGDYATNIAMVLKQGVPQETAEKIKSELTNSVREGVLKNIVSQIEVAAPGFINFVLEDAVVWEEMLKSETPPENKNRRTILVEYGQENIAKPMSVGHLRSNIIGQSLVNIFKFLGEKTISDNHLGDWGTQFGQLIVAFKKWGDKKIIEQDPINELVKLYVKFNKEAEEGSTLQDSAREEFKKLEDDDEENKKLWEWFHKESLKEFKKMHAKLGVHFDYMHGEAFYKNDLQNIIDELLDKKIAKINEDKSIIVEFKDKLKDTPLLIQKSDGATLYSTRDLAAIKFYTKEFNPDLILQCVGTEQELYFKQFYTVAERAEWIKRGDFVHIKNGLVRLPEGKMSTRKGRTIRLEELFDETEKRMAKILNEKNSELSETEKKELVKILSVGAIIFSDLGQSREENIIFSWEKALSFDGYAAPYLQYTYARAKSILRKETASEIKFEKFFAEKERELALKLANFQNEVLKASVSYHPHIIARYLFELAQLFNAFYHSLPVLKAAPDEKNLRLALVEKTASVLQTGLGLLNIKAPERM